MKSLLVFAIFNLLLGAHCSPTTKKGEIATAFDLPDILRDYRTGSASATTAPPPYDDGFSLFGRFPDVSAKPKSSTAPIFSAATQVKLRNLFSANSCASLPRVEKYRGAFEIVGNHVQFFGQDGEILFEFDRDECIDQEAPVTAQADPVENDIREPLYEAEEFSAESNVFHGAASFTGLEQQEMPLEIAFNSEEQVGTEDFSEAANDAEDHSEAASVDVGSFGSGPRVKSYMSAKERKLQKAARKRNENQRLAAAAAQLTLPVPEEQQLKPVNDHVIAEEAEEVPELENDDFRVNDVGAQIPYGGGDASVADTKEEAEISNAKSTIEDSFVDEEPVQDKNADVELAERGGVSDMEVDFPKVEPADPRLEEHLALPVPVHVDSEPASVHAGPHLTQDPVQSMDKMLAQLKKERTVTAKAITSLEAIIFPNVLKLRPTIKNGNFPEISAMFMGRFIADGLYIMQEYADALTTELLQSISTDDDHLNTLRFEMAYIAAVAPAIKQKLANLKESCTSFFRRLYVTSKQNSANPGLKTVKVSGRSLLKLTKVELFHFRREASELRRSWLAFEDTQRSLLLARAAVSEILLKAGDILPRNLEKFCIRTLNCGDAILAIFEEHQKLSPNYLSRLDF